MDIKTSYEKYAVNFEELIEQKQIITQTSLDASTKGGVKKILFSQSDVLITGFQAAGKQLKIMGKVFIKIVYMDLENNIQSFDYISDFIENMVTKNIISEDRCDVRGTVVDLQSSIINDEIRIQSVIQLFVAAIGEQEANLLVSVENAIYQQDLEKFQIFEKYLNEDETITNDFDPNMKVDNIILFDPKASIVDVQYEENKIFVLGQVVANILYQSDGKLYQKDMTFTFDKSIETQVKTPEICPYCVIKDSRLIIQGDDKQNTFKVEIDIIIKGALFNIEERDIIVDLYSPKFNTQIEQEYIPYYIKDGIIVNEEKVNGLTEIESDIPIKRVLSCSVIQNSIISLLSVPGEIVNEGLIIAACIYELENGNIDSVQIEMPYSIRIDNRNLVSGCRLEANTLSLSAISRIRKDNEIEVVVTLISSICKCAQNIVKGIENVKVLDEKQFNNSAISVYKPIKGESLWDVAKKMGMQQEEIKAQNVDIPDIMEGNENIIIYRELNV